MNLGQIGTIIVACIVSAGGIGGIIVAIVKWSSNIIADRLSQKYQLQLDKEIEKYKTKLRKKNMSVKQDSIRSFQSIEN